uniref:Cathepsin propeptide inhibitor domain-containing protein n=1 Tax=Setaria italica TaxID=4555 RepID=K4AIJ5_SETIT
PHPFQSPRSSREKKSEGFGGGYRWVIEAARRGGFGGGGGGGGVVSMALRSLCSLVRGATRARTCSSSPGIAVQGGLGGARRFHSLRDLVIEHAHGSPAALIAAAFSVFAGISNMIDTDESDKARMDEDTEAEARTEEDPSMRTDAYLRYMQASKDMLREMASYNKALPGKNPIDEVALDQEGMKNDEAMRARFEDWMKQYGRTYQDEEEKARRFKIFKAVARFVDVTNAVADELEFHFCMGLNEFSDWNHEEFAGRCGTKHMSDDEYFSMIGVNEADKKAIKQ